MSDERMLVEFDSDHGPVKLNENIVRRYLVSGNGNPTDQEVARFLKLCQYQRLNPFLREAYLVKFGSNPATLITGKDVFTKRAAKSELFNGMESGVVVRTEKGLDYRPGQIVLKNEELVGAWAKVYRKDWEYPIHITVSLDEYIGRKSDGSVNSQWKRMPGTMIVKVAKVQALRDAFPEDFQGLYDASEMGHVGEAEPPKEPPKEDAEEAEYTVEDDDPQEPPQGDGLEGLRSDVSALLDQVAELNTISEKQVDIFRKQLTTLKSDVALRAMAKNFERQIAAGHQGEL